MSEFHTVDYDAFMALFDFPGRFLQVNASLDLGERFRRIRANYRRYQAMVDAGLAEWFKGDPYELADWLTIFTPIEFSMWQDIRGRGLDLWPQLPVGRYFVDFGNPAAKVAIECDGKQWHTDQAKDAERDQVLYSRGWTVLRVPGWQCNGRILCHEEAEVRGIEDRAAWNKERTPLEALERAAEILESARDESAWERKNRRRTHA